MFIIVSSIVAISISIVSALVASISLWLSWSLYKIERARRSEERAASLISYFHLNEGRRSLRVENKGKGEARNIRLFLDGQPIEQHRCWVPNQSKKITTLPGLGHGDLILRLPSSKPIPKLAKIHWQDDVKEENVSRSSLTL